MAFAQTEYAQELDNYLAKSNLKDKPNPVELYHLVRNIPYGSKGMRTPQEVLQYNEGSCSGKHILLRDLLHQIGEKAEIETIEGDFAASIPAHQSMSPELQQYCKLQNVTDFHHYVVWHTDGQERKLDATWPDNIIEMGIPGNDNWTGEGDTLLAVLPKEVLGREEDIIRFKEALLNQLTKDEREYRQKFLTLLTDWVSTISDQGDVK